MKKIFSAGTMVKLFFLTSISTANPAVACTGGPGTASNATVSISEESPAIIHLTEESFKKMIFDYDKNDEWKYAGTKPAIIDFYADWCAPCRQLSPLVEELANEYKGKIVVYKVDTEKERKLAQKAGITALPTLLFIPMKGKPQVSMGLVPKEELEKAINDLLLTK